MHRRGVKLIKELFDEAEPADGPWLGGDRDNLAYLVLRIVESLYFAELLAGMPPDRELAESTTRALLTGALVPRRPSGLKAVDAASAVIWTSLPAVLCDGSLTLAALRGF